MLCAGYSSTTTSLSDILETLFRSVDKTMATQTSANLQCLDINPRKGLLAAGESAGADIALGIAHLWTAARTSPPLTGIYSCATSAANTETVPKRYKGHLLSFEQNADAPMQTIEAYEIIQSKFVSFFTSEYKLHAIFREHPNHNGARKETTNRTRRATSPFRWPSQTPRSCPRRTSRRAGGTS